MRSPVSHVGDALHSYFSGMSLNEVKYNIEHQYNDSPSISTIYRWIDRFTEVAKDKVKGIKPNVGDTWVADETVIKINRKKYWLFDCIDSKTRFLLASHISPNRGTREAHALMEKAMRRAAPKVIMTDKLRTYLDGIELTFGGEAKHKQGSPFNVEINTNLIERFQRTLKDRTKVLRGLKKPETAKKFIEGWLIHYNYFRPYISLKGKTPARKARAVFFSISCSSVRVNFMTILLYQTFQASF
jgi:putative transposase